MAGWTGKYRVVGIQPGPVVFPKFGEVDLSNSKLDITLVDAIYASGCSYLEKIEKKAKAKDADPVD